MKTTFNYSRLEGFSKSGFNLVKEINDLNPLKVVDFGCGENLFKGLVKNLVGIDYNYHQNIDIHSNILDLNFEKDSIDVSLCLGSLQYEKLSENKKILSKIVEWTKPKGLIIVRNQPFTDYIGHNENYLTKESIERRMSSNDFYTWSKELNIEIYKDIELDVNKNDPTIERLVWWWQKK